MLTQSGPLPKGADVDAAFANFKSAIKPKLQSNSIQMLKLAMMLNMGVSFFTRLGFLQEIEKGDLAWRPLNSSGINTLRIGLVVSAQRELSPPAEQFGKVLCEALLCATPVIGSSSGAIPWSRSRPSGAREVLHWLPEPARRALLGGCDAGGGSRSPRIASSV